MTYLAKREKAVRTKNYKSIPIVCDSNSFLWDANNHHSLLCIFLFACAALFYTKWYLCNYFLSDNNRPAAMGNHLGTLPNGEIVND